MKQDKNTLKSYFETGDKPTQNQYEDLIDSLRHLDEKISLTDLDGNLSDNSKLDKNQVAGNPNRRFVINADGSVTLAPELGILQNVEFIDSADTDTKKDSLKFTFNGGNETLVNINELFDTGAFNSIAKGTLEDKKISFSTIGENTIDLDLNDWFNSKMNDTEPLSLTLTPIINGGITESHETLLDIGSSKDGIFWIDDLPSSSNNLLTIKLEPKGYKFFANIVLMIESDTTSNRELMFEFNTGTGIIYDVSEGFKYSASNHTNLISQTEILDAETNLAIPQIMRFDIGIWYYQIDNQNVADIEIIKKVGRRKDGN